MASWRRIAFTIPPGSQEDLIVCLHELGTLGTQIEDDRVVGWFEAGVDAQALLSGVSARLAVAAPRIAADEEVEDGRWHERWVERLAPFPIGERFLIVPGASAPDDPGDRRVIRLTPGRAFGTGEHATTRMCVALLERTVRPGDCLLDVGTGSGILAIVASRLGAGFVVGVDIDETALGVAALNLGLDEAPGVVLVGGTLDALREVPFDVVVANLTEPSLTRLMKGLASRTRRRAILSGLLVEDEAAVIAAARREGLTPESRLHEDDWVALSLARDSRD